MNIPVKEVASIVQVCFYIVGSTIAILTYKSAKKGLLNTVNTEYQKRVMDHLDELSETLYAEFNPDSDIYWGHRESDHRIEHIVKNTTYEFIEHLKENGDSKSFDPISIYQMPDIYKRLYKLIERVKSDPFLPDDISKYVVDYLTKRRELLLKIVQNKLEDLRQTLREEKYSSLDALPIIIHNQINQELYKNGIGIEQVETEVHRIRGLIKEHLKSYNPLKK